MQIQIKHYGFVKGGIKTYYNPELYRDQLAALEGVEFVEIIKKKHEKPSSNIYNYYRGCILPICFATDRFNGLDNKDEVHSKYFAQKFLTHTELVAIGEDKYEIVITRSLADLNKDEMTDFVNRCIVDCNDNNITIPESSDYYNKWYNK